MASGISKHPPAHLLELAERVAEAAADPRYAPRKEMWTRHNRLEKQAKAPVYVCIKPGSGPDRNPVTWAELIPPDTRISRDPFEAGIELQLRQRLYKHEHIPDDEVLRPTVWINPVRPRASAQSGGDCPSDERSTPAGQAGALGASADAARLWGLPFLERRTADAGGAYAVDPVVTNEDDLARAQHPRYEVDEIATRALWERATELVGGKVQVKIATDEVAFSPSEVMISLVGMEAVLYGVIDRPDFIHAIMDFVTQGMIAYHRAREAAGGIDPEETWNYRVPYEILRPEDDPGRLTSAWTFIAAQSMCGISPAMYEEFVQPYHARLAELAGDGRVYYHGCEDLTAKIPIIRQLPNLRRFHVSPWTDVESAAEQLGRDFVLEVVPHPETLCAQTPAEMRAVLEHIMDVAGDCVLDICLGEIETVYDNPAVLTTWAQIAQEVTARHA